MSYWARLVYGHRYLDLATTPYDIGLDYSPPPLNRQVNYTGAIRQGIDGSKRIGEQYGDRNWAVSFRVLGDNETECNEATRKLSTFLENARNTRFKLYFEYYPQAAIGILPIYGQGVYRYHVKDAFLSINSVWGVRDKWVGGVINFLIAPTAEGLRQRLATAKGHVYEDTVRTSTGESRGVYVCPPVTNYMTNPVFSHTTWNAGWTANGEMVATKITDPAYVPFGDASVKLQAYGTAGTVAYTQTLALTNGSPYLMSCYVRMMDGHEPGSNEVQMWYGSALGAPSTYHVGDGWYRIYDTITGTASLTKTGLSLRDFGVALYASGFQVEPSLTSPTPLVYGDALGCSWAGTRGSSTSTGGTAQLRLPISAETIDQAAGAIRMVVKWDVPASYVDNMYFFECDSSLEGRFGAYFNAGDDTIKFDSGGNVLTSVVQSFAVNTINVFHFVWGKTSSGSAQVALYINGSGTVSATLGVGVQGSYLYIGSKGYASPLGNPLRGTILDFTVWKQNINATQVAVDYAQVCEWVTSGDPYPLDGARGGVGSTDNLGNRLNTIPYLWTKDGDDITDAYYDATHNDWAVAHGIPGNLPAHTVFDILATFSENVEGGILLANHTYDKYLDMANTFSGTDVALTVGTAAVSFPGSGTAISITRDLDAYRGKKGYIITALIDQGTVSQGAMMVHYDTESNSFVSEYTTLQGDGTAPFNWFILGPMLVPEAIPGHIDWKQGYGELNFKFKLKRSAGTGSVTMDQYRLMTGNIVYIPTTLTTYHSIVLDGNDVYVYNSNNGKEDGLATMYGDVIELEPGKYNHLNTLPMMIGRAVDITDTVTFNRTYVIPRWSTI